MILLLRPTKWLHDKWYVFVKGIHAWFRDWSQNKRLLSTGDKKHKSAFVCLGSLFNVHFCPCSPFDGCNPSVHYKQILLWHFMYIGIVNIQNYWLLSCWLNLPWTLIVTFDRKSPLHVCSLYSIHNILGHLYQYHSCLRNCSRRRGTMNRQHIFNIYPEKFSSTRLPMPAQSVFESRAAVHKSLFVSRTHRHHLYHEICSIKASCLTHRDRDKIVVISQRTFSHAFSRMKIQEFRLRFHWSFSQGSH